MALLQISSDLLYIVQSFDMCSLLSMPVPLLMLQEAGIKAYQAELLTAWDRHRPAIEAVDSSLTLQELRHAAGVVRGEQQQQHNDTILTAASA
jgi:hypothetical protein